MTQRLTAVQRDVIDRLKDGWELYELPLLSGVLRKPGEASRHVKQNTMLSLINRGIVKGNTRTWTWVLVDGADV